MSYLLAGNWPYYSGGALSDPHLQFRLEQEPNTSLVEQVGDTLILRHTLHMCIILNNNLTDLLPVPSKHSILDQCCLMLGQRRRRWINIKSALSQSIVFSGPFH